jgi:predicted dehydrogenase
MKFGLVGTGYWARITQGAGLAAEPEVDLIAVWGRDPDKTAALAGGLGVDVAASYDELLERVDAVAFAVPPHVQAALAVQAAEAGKHLLLEKPIATSLADADALVAAADAAGVASVVFFTARYDQARRDWLDGLGGGAWEGGWARWFAANFVADSPYASSAWRWDRGALWDLGPHLLALLTPPLGPVVGVSATAGVGDLVHLVFEHEFGATSTASATLRAPREAAGHELAFWGPTGIATMPEPSGSSAQNLATAARELIAEAASGRRSHPCDVHFGRHVVKILAEAEAQMSAAAGSGA